MKFACTLLITFALAFSLQAQTAILNGQVTDESGAIIPGAKVTLSGPRGLVKTATVTSNGSYSFTGLPVGEYTVVASAPDLTQPQPIKINLTGGTQKLNLQLKVSEVVQQVTVQSNSTPLLSTEPSNNAGALVLSGNDLQSLSDDPDDLQQDLQALAGPSSGPGGGEIMIDGFSNGTLPSKDSIREIRINQNPFSPEYSKLGYGRIEIFTKPGSDKFRGQLFFDYGNDVWNSRNPYAGQKAPFEQKEYGGSLSGPLSKKTSFFLDVEQRSITNGAVIDAVTLDPQSLAIIPDKSVGTTPYQRTRVSPRVDYQLGANDTLMLRYGYTRSDIHNSGIGTFNLPSRASNSLNTDHTVQATETHVMGTTVDETRFEYYRTDVSQIAANLTPAILVLGSFNGGGSQVGRSFDTQNYYELQNYVSMMKGAHSWKFGVRMRGETDNNTSPLNFGGTFTFGGGLAPELDPNNQPIIGPDGNPVLTQITSIEQYQRTLQFQQLGYTPEQIRALGGGATQFSITAGNPTLGVNQFDVAGFVGDDWRVRPNVTLSLGMRYETQTNIHNYSDIAPRLGFAWAPGASKMSLHPAFVIRGGFGIFYDRFSMGNVLTAERYNGIVQQQYIINNPDFFPTVPSIASLGNVQATRSSIQEIDSHLHAPELLQSAISIEKQLPARTTLSVTYSNSHGLYQLRTNDINAPLPGTYIPSVPNSGVFPYGTTDPIMLMQSSGLYNQNQMIVNVNSRMNQNITLFGFYTLNYARSNTDGLGTLPSNPYNYSGEYGPAITDIRNRAFFGGSINSRWNLRLSPYIIVQSGAPYDITVGHDLYGDTEVTGRPGIPTTPADLAKPGLVMTPYGLLDPNPSPDEAILPRNFGRGPGSITVNMRLSKTFGFGPENGGGGASPSSSGGHHGGGGGAYSTGGGFHSIFGPSSTNRRYNLTLSISARNLLNHVNPGPIVGNVTSPLFGESNSIAGGYGAFNNPANNRRIELQLRFTF
ncbi:MAG TPA: TonB-dependent receptor [Bryobacteraceae bacterium]|nr:TonB-dependent receptor [Bryobacteraceae bacterium]